MLFILSASQAGPSNQTQSGSVGRGRGLSTQAQAKGNSQSFRELVAFLSILYYYYYFFFEKALCKQYWLGIQMRITIQESPQNSTKLLRIEFEEVM